MSLSSLENSGLFAACVLKADGVAASALVDARFLLDIGQTVQRGHASHVQLERVTMPDSTQSRHRFQISNMSEPGLWPFRVVRICPGPAPFA